MTEELDMRAIKVIAFDADDTLWVNEPFFQDTEKKFSDMLENYLPSHTVTRELLTVEIANMKLYGYGIKAFMLSMIETAIKVTGGNIKPNDIQNIIELGKEMLSAPVDVLEGVEDVLTTLNGKYRIVMATKGDLLDQERKLTKSGLARYFHHTEIVSEKHEDEYRRIIRHLDIEPEEFLMVGNSLKSDILPILNIGGTAFHVPFHTTWELEKIDTEISHDRFRQLANIREVLKFV